MMNNPYIIGIIIIVAALAYICLSNWFKSKKAQDHYENMLAQIAVGSKVKLMTGIYGEITEIQDYGELKVVTLKLKDGSLMEVDSKAVYGIDERKSVAALEELDKLEQEKEEQNIVEEQTIEEEIEEVQENLEAEPAQEIEVEPVEEVIKSAQKPKKAKKQNKK